MSNFPFLDALSQEIDKAHFETEEQAKNMIQRDLVELREVKDQVFKHAASRISEHGERLSAMKADLDKTLERMTSNSGTPPIRPSGQTSSDNNSKS